MIPVFLDFELSEWLKDNIITMIGNNYVPSLGHFIFLFLLSHQLQSSVYVITQKLRASKTANQASGFGKIFF